MWDPFAFMSDVPREHLLTISWLAATPKTSQEEDVSDEVYRMGNYIQCVFIHKK